MEKLADVIVSVCGHIEGQQRPTM